VNAVVCDETPLLLAWDETREGAIERGVSGGGAETMRIGWKLVFRDPFASAASGMLP
jgi:hypothetical protein